MAESEPKAILKESVEFELPNGTKVTLGPLKQENFENISKWIRLRYLQNVRSVLSEFPQKEQEVIMCKAVKDAALMSVRTEEGLQVLYESVHGYALLCYEMIQAPKITFEEFEGIVFPDEEDYSKYMHVLNDMFFAVYNELFSDNFDLLATRTIGSETGDEQHK